MFLQCLIALLLAVHLVCMNISSAGPLLCIWIERYRKKDPETAFLLGQSLLRASIQYFFVGASVGLLMAGLLWIAGNTEFFEVLAIFGSRVYWGISELVFYVVCVWLQLLLWKKEGRKRAILRGFLGVLAATNLLYHFPPLFTAMAEYARTDYEAAHRLTSAEYRELIFTARIMSISCHFWLASIAVTGAWIMFKYRKSDTPWPVQMGARFALLTTAFQMLVGLWVVVSLFGRVSNCITLQILITSKVQCFVELDCPGGTKSAQRLSAQRQSAQRQSANRHYISNYKMWG